MKFNVQIEINPETEEIIEFTTEEKRRLQNEIESKVHKHIQDTVKSTINKEVGEQIESAAHTDVANRVALYLKSDEAKEMIDGACKRISYRFLLEEAEKKAREIEDEIKDIQKKS